MQRSGGQTAEAAAAAEAAALTSIRTVRSSTSLSGREALMQDELSPATVVGC
jgi:hypothetical protein